MTHAHESLRDRLLSMTQDEIVAFWKAEQERKRAAGEAYHTVLYAAVTGRNADTVVARA